MTSRRVSKLPVTHSERRTKSRHDGSSSSQPQAASSQAPDLTFGYLFEDDIPSHEKFVKFFMTRKICEPKSLDSAFFNLERFDIVPLLEQTHLLHLAEMRCPYSEVMVRAFYQNLGYSQGELTSRVCGIDIIMTAPIWTELLGFDFDGVTGAALYDGDSHHIFGDYNRETIVTETRRADAEPGHFAQILTCRFFQLWLSCAPSYNVSSQHVAILVWTQILVAQITDLLTSNLRASHNHHIGSPTRH
ncbi:uncharacterized protein LOC133309623 [Gastrolobium bilobum]|uniref:uncharacterized protein LOC133309623 n=1 Tax=Gastrolobium bilobum TaxID=150636 RepID=UPI002AAFBA8E|nr:uncharacterized protein LOC133309623 [Gastrolobium bilobum]XP_061366403.1 uncharacterized protein LOC133309623 [Gastrolobium bilobum]